MKKLVKNKISSLEYSVVEVEKRNFSIVDPYLFIHLKPTNENGNMSFATLGAPESMQESSDDCWDPAELREAVREYEGGY